MPRDSDGIGRVLGGDTPDDSNVQPELTATTLDESKAFLRLLDSMIL